MRDGRTTWFGHIKQMLCLGIVSVIAGVLLLVLAFCIPVDVMTKHVSASVDKVIADSSEISGGAWKQYIYANKESYTDAIMVQNAIERIPGKNVFEHAMWAYHLDLDENIWTPEVSVKYLSKGGDRLSMFLHQYSRYWHGYLVYLKPLLLVFTWEQILWIGAVLQIVLLLAVLAVSVKTGHLEAGIAILMALCFMKPLLMLASLAMTVCWLITLIVVLVILLKHTWLEQKDHYPELFLMTGILVAYFDFLTYPMVTLGFPLCVYFLIQKECKLKENMIRIIAYSASWGLGYVAMWASKWVLADLTLHTGTIKSAVGSILGWTEAIGGRPRISGGLYVVSLNLQEYDLWIYPVLLGILLAFDASVFFFAAAKGSLKRAISRCVPYLLVACIPFAWYIAVQHHSGLHVAFTFRIISVACLAFGAIGLDILRMVRKESAADHH